uniref:Reverse transcriptase/retrotransposon-derived protein RNase H-like domain-containing protein n=1 Tax=Phasianus colchicus TaxID=9054 RepID=A0A669NZ12_PHACC
MALVKFSREFIEGFAEKAAPLCKLLRKDALWEWGPEQDEAVKTLKESVAQAPMLVWPCGDRPYVLQLASVGTGLRATLSQHRGALLQPIAHASRLKSPHPASMGWSSAARGMGRRWGSRSHSGHPCLRAASAWWMPRTEAMWYGL